MATIQFDREEVLQAIDTAARQTMNMDMPWDWPCGVAYYGRCEAARATGREEYLQLMKERVDEYIELGLPGWTVNTCAMGHAMLTLHQWTGDQRYKAIAEQKIDYLRTDTEQGVEVRVDTLYSFSITVTGQEGTDTFLLDCRRADG